MRKFFLSLSAYFVSALAGPVLVSSKGFQTQAYDWPQWLGPHRNGVSQETGLLNNWPREGPPLLWKAKGLGSGYSTPSVAAGRVFTMGNRSGREYVVALSVHKGKQLWRTST